MAAQQTAAPVDQELIVPLEVKVSERNRVHSGWRCSSAKCFPEFYRGAVQRG